VTQGKLGDDSVSNAKLQSDSVSQGKLQGDSVSQGKIRQGAVTAGKVTGPLGLGKVAAVVASANPDPPLTPANGCSAAPDVAVAGIQAGDSILVLPKPNAATNDDDFAPMAGQADPATGQVKVVFCNSSDTDADNPDPQRVTIALFR
jgi:hypothetical protein